eukprot:9680413-Alexandrium_andersonii.AAC.1
MSKSAHITASNWKWGPGVRRHIPPPQTDPESQAAFASARNGLGSRPLIPRGCADCGWEDCGLEPA